MNGSKQKKYTPLESAKFEPRVFVVKFKTEKDDMKGSWEIAKIAPISIREDGASAINKAQLDELIRLGVHFQLLSIPPRSA
ncbi:MAG: hypothetical protein ACYC7D_15925 [Nitrososphaerales archaeon]